MDVDKLLEHWAFVHTTVKPIETDEEHTDALARYEQLFAKHMNDPENAVIRSLLENVGVQIHAFESERYIIPEAAPGDVLAFLMDSNGLSQSELAREVSIDQGTISKLLKGVRAFSKAQAKNLGTFFSVPVEVFI
ncbi:helix-turn-helix domain-containing protein [Deinococcus kurensis]|uniref:helix-turn-helix domain-containing protein n=1 Tax=Deinococcus kurensis TaxID=2662757 RepID=UPI001390FC92|nr:helix-turn-helix domain-containing protein [Deinococcus kurensis]